MRARHMALHGLLAPQMTALMLSSSQLGTPEAITPACPNFKLAFLPSSPEVHPYGS